MKQKNKDGNLNGTYRDPIVTSLLRVRRPSASTCRLIGSDGSLSWGVEIDVTYVCKRTHQYVPISSWLIKLTGIAGGEVTWKTADTTRYI